MKARPVSKQIQVVMVTCLWMLAATLFLNPGSASAEPVAQTKQSGPVKVTLKLDSDSPLIGDVITLSIQVVAEKDVEVLMPEFGEALDRFMIVDFAPRETIDDRGRTEFTQRYRLQPPYSGKQSIPPILVEFVDRRPGKDAAPPDQDAYEILTDRLDFEVRSVVPKTASNDLKPPMGKLRTTTETAIVTSPWLLAASLIALISIVAIGLFFALRRGHVRRQSAYDVARERLNQLLVQGNKQAASIESFYVELSAIVRRYLEDRFDLRAPELTTEEFLETVKSSPVLTSEHQSLLQGFLTQADLVKFAGFHPDAEATSRSIQAAEKFLEETKEGATLSASSSNQRHQSTKPDGNVSAEVLDA